MQPGTAKSDRRTDIIISLISGTLLVLSFPPFDYYPLAWIALAPLLIVLRGKTAGVSFLLGTLTGFVYFLGTVYWIFHSMYFYGYIPAPMSILILISLSLYLALYTGVFSLLFNYTSGRTGLPALFAVPVLWVALEYIRTYALTGFPWSSLGYSQYKFLPLIQVADITGIYGVSFLTAATNGIIADTTIFLKHKRDTLPVPFRPSPYVCLPLYVVLIISSLTYGGIKLREEDGSRKITVSVVQGNIPQDKKWDTAFQNEVMSTYMRLSFSAAGGSPDLIVWPETAVPFIFGYNNNLSNELAAFQKQLNTWLLFGSMLTKDAGQDNSRLSNSAVLLSPAGDVLSTYDKMHLVPYGEYVPLRKLFPFISKLTAGIGDFLPGQEPVIMQLPFAKIGNLICYEIIFPGLVREFADSGADVLVTITNDAWFGRTSAPYQHFSMAVFRAVENRRPVVRAANTGISGFIDSKGRISRKSDIFVEAALTEKITPVSRKSFYTKYGDLFAYFCIISSVILVIFRKASGRRG